MKLIIVTLVKVFRRIQFAVNSSLKYKFIAYFLMLSVIPIIILGSASYVVIKDIMEDRAAKNSINLVTNEINSFDYSNSYKIESVLNDITSLTDTYVWLKSINENISSNDFIVYDTVSKISARLDSVINQGGDTIKSIAIIPKREGTLLLKATNDFDYSNVYEKGGVFDVTSKKPFEILWRMVDDVDNNGTNYIRVSKAVYDIARDETIGIMVIYIDMSYFESVFEGAAREKGSFDILIDNKDVVLYHSGKARNLPYSDLIAEKFENDEILAQIRKSDVGSFKCNIDDERKIIAYATSKITGSKLISVIPYENIRQDIYTVPQTALIITLICAVYAVLVAIYVYRSIYSPIRKLMKGINKLGEGDLDIRINSKRVDELGRLSNNFDDMTGEMKKLIENIETQEKKKKETEIKFLQAQITPHFLYNTLNAIKSLARLGRNDDISSMVVALISLLRISVSNKSDFISIEEEINYVNSYIRIMEYRYDKKINIVYDIDDKVKQYGIMKFTVQPIIENCIIHAFNDAGKDAVITISAYAKDANIIVEVSDNGIGMDAEKINEALKGIGDNSHARFSGIGIYNINERIKLNFGGQYGIKYASKAGKGTTVYINIPYFKANTADE